MFILNTHRCRAINKEPQGRGSFSQGKAVVTRRESRNDQLKGFNVVDIVGQGRKGIQGG